MVGGGGTVGRHGAGRWWWCWAGGVQRLSGLTMTSRADVRFTLLKYEIIKQRAGWTMAMADADDGPYSSLHPATTAATKTTLLLLSIALEI